jgi:hypothetical protein
MADEQRVENRAHDKILLELWLGSHPAFSGVNTAAGLLTLDFGLQARINSPAWVHRR